MTTTGARAVEARAEATPSDTRPERGTGPGSARRTRRAIVLDGTPAGDTTGPRVRAAVEAALADAGWAAEAILVRERRIGACGGEFSCWVKQPGVCMTDDDNRPIAAAMIASDLVVWLTPVRFGGFASPLKRMADHQIPLIAPTFTTVEGETHHARRYRRYPSTLAVGWQDRPDPTEAATFRALAVRNGRNFHAPAVVAGVVEGAASDAAIRSAVDGWVAAVGRGERARPEGLPASPLAAPGPAPRRAVVLVGSPRLGRSTSHALGAHLAARLERGGVAVETLQLHPAARSAARTAAVLEAVDAADLVVLAAPLYIDSLPGPVVEVLERVADHRAGRGEGGSARLAAIVNCGFPESEHNLPALAICAAFARRAGLEWAGGLALGGGEGLLHGSAPASAGGRARHVVEALDLAGDALAAGHPVPERARARMARPFVPPWLYRAMGSVGWRVRAWPHGMALALGRRPYAP